jgi:predicted TIM-barrel fold metal-dependent hydrolase
MYCDAHVHIVGLAEHYPQVPTRVFLAGIADLETLRRLGAARGITRFAIVQPSFYGTDNTLLLETLDQLGDDGRGVAVIDAGMPAERLAELVRRGVRGLRLNLYSPLKEREAAPLRIAFLAAAKVAQALGWHVEVIASLAVLLHHAAMIAGSAAPVVIDHYGVYGRSRPDSTEGRGLLELMSLPHVWTKLSAPYRVSDDPLATRPDPAWLAAILERSVDRCVWGSDWPHIAPHETLVDPTQTVPYRNIPYERSIDDFLAVLGSAELAGRVMRDNPARLYGFPA